MASPTPPSSIPPLSPLSCENSDKKARPSIISVNVGVSIHKEQVDIVDELFVSHLHLNHQKQLEQLPEQEDEVEVEEDDEETKKEDENNKSNVKEDTDDDDDSIPDHPQPDETPAEYYTRIRPRLKYKHMRKIMAHPDDISTSPSSTSSSPSSPTGQPFWSSLRQHILTTSTSFTFTNKPLVHSLRLLCSSIPFPREGQQINRLLMDFGRVYHAQNEKVFKSWEHVYFILNAVLILNTYLHLHQRQQLQQLHDNNRNSVPVEVPFDEIRESFSELEGVKKNVNDVFMRSVFKGMQRMPIRGLDVGMDDLYNSSSSNERRGRGDDDLFQVDTSISKPSYITYDHQYDNYNDQYETPDEDLANTAHLRNFDIHHTTYVIYHSSYPVPSHLTRALIERDRAHFSLFATSEGVEGGLCGCQEVLEGGRIEVNSNLLNRRLSNYNEGGEDNGYENGDGDGGGGMKRAISQFSLWASTAVSSRSHSRRPSVLLSPNSTPSYSEDQNSSSSSGSSGGPRMMRRSSMSAMLNTISATLGRRKYNAIPLFPHSPICEEISFGQFDLNDEGSSMPVVNGDLTRLFSGGGGGEVMTTLPFMISLLYFSMNRSGIDHTFNKHTIPIYIKSEIVPSDHYVADLVSSADFLEFLSRWLEKPRQDYDVIITSGPIIRKNAESSKSFFEMTRHGWKGLFACLVLPKPTRLAPKPGAELWLYDTKKTRELQSKITEDYCKLDEEFVRDLEGDGQGGHLRVPTTTSTTKTTTGASILSLQKDRSKSTLAPTKRIPMTNYIAYSDESYRKYAGTIHLSHPHEFPAPIDKTSHVPLESPSSHNTRSIQLLMSFLGSQKEPDLRVEKGMSEPEFQKAILQGVCMRHTSRRGDEFPVQFWPSKAVQWRQTLNHCAALSLFVVDMGKILQYSGGRLQWTQFVDIVKSHHIDSLKSWRKWATVLPASLAFLEKGKSVEELEAMHKAFMKLFNSIDIESLAVPELIDQFSLYFSDDSKLLFSKIDEINNQVAEHKQLDKVAVFEVMMRWIQVMYSERATIMRKNIEECTMNLNQLDMALLQIIQENGNDDAKSSNEFASFAHLQSDFVFDVGSAQRRGYLASKSAKSDGRAAQHDGHSSTRTSSSISSALNSTPALMKLNGVKRIEADIEYYEREVEWMRIEFERWQTYSYVLEMCIRGMSL